MLLHIYRFWYPIFYYILRGWLSYDTLMGVLKSVVDIYVKKNSVFTTTKNILFYKQTYILWYNIYLLFQ